MKVKLIGGEHHNEEIDVESLIPTLRMPIRENMLLTVPPVDGDPIPFNFAYEEYNLVRLENGMSVYYIQGKINEEMPF